MSELETVLTKIAELERRQRDQAELLAATAGLSEKLAQVSELVADLEVKVGSEEEKQGPDAQAYAAVA